MSKNRTANKGSGKDTFTLINNRTGDSHQLPLLTARSASVIDVRKLYAETGYFTYDPGFTSTGSCESKITYIDGDKGELLYRGYPIEEIAENSDFMETCYLLLYGDLPNIEQKKKLETGITYHSMLHEQIQRFFSGFRRDSHPMSIICGVVGALSAFYHDSLDISDPRHRMVASYRMIAKIPTIAAWAYVRIGQPFIYPKNGLSYSNASSTCCSPRPAIQGQSDHRQGHGQDDDATRIMNKTSTSTCSWRDPRAPIHSLVFPRHRLAVRTRARRRQRSRAEHAGTDRRRKNILELLKAKTRTIPSA